jgi:hypothetical protein
MSLGVLLMLIGLAGWVLVVRSPKLVRSAGKPLAEPRILTYLDSWQTVIFGAGEDTEAVRARLMERFSSADQKRFACSLEKIWHWGLDGKIEREQIVLRYGRGLVYCQVYHYGSDIYVGWDAHMNVGTWQERKLASGIDRESGKRVELMTVERAVQVASEYDRVDLNCLIEWTHAQVTQAVRRYLKEREIDQEIDFTIIRGDRQAASQSEEERKKEKRRRFQRKV